MRQNASRGVKGYNYNHCIHFGFMATCPIDRPESNVFPSEDQKR